MSWKAGKWVVCKLQMHIAQSYHAWDEYAFAFVLHRKTTRLVPDLANAEGICTTSTWSLHNMLINWTLTPASEYPPIRRTIIPNTKLSIHTYEIRYAYMMASGDFRPSGDLVNPVAVRKRWSLIFRLSTYLLEHISFASELASLWPHHTAACARSNGPWYKH